MIPHLGRQKALDRANISVRGCADEKRVGVATMLPFRALPSWYNQYWLEEADCPRRVYLLGRFETLTLVALICLQLAGLWTLNFAGFWVVEKTRLPIPGNLVGMLTLFVLLTAGVVKIGWFELTGSFLIKHLAFFFVPITVGLMNAGPLLLEHGLGIILVLTISATIGILLAGFVSQSLLAKR